MRRFLPLLLCWPLLTGAAASSRLFDGANDEVDWGNVMDVTTNDVSWCVCFNGTEDASDDFPLGKRSGTALGYNTYQTSTDEARCVVDDDVVVQSAVGTADIDGVWTHICCVWNSTDDDLFLYEGAVQTASDVADTIGTLTNAANLQSGEASDNANDANGLVAFASIYLSKVLTASEVLEEFHKVGSLAADFRAPIMGDNPEPEWQAKLSGTQSGTDASSASGPPTMMGPWGYSP